MRLTDKLWWFRYGFAVIAALISTYLIKAGFLSGPNVGGIFILAFALYILSYYIARYVLKIDPGQLPKRRDLALQGVFAYFIAWFAFTILFFTLTTQLMFS